MNESLFSFTNPFRHLRYSPAPREIVLRSNDHWKLSSVSAKDSIHCKSGTVWITCEGQREDVVLTAGHQWKPVPRGVTVIGALSDAVVRFGEAA